MPIQLCLYGYSYTAIRIRPSLIEHCPLYIATRSSLSRHTTPLQDYITIHIALIIDMIEIRQYNLNSIPYPYRPGESAIFLFFLPVYRFFTCTFRRNDAIIAHRAQGAEPARRIDAVSKLEGAIEALLEELQIQMNQVADTKKTINALLRRIGKDPQFPEEAAEQVSSVTLRIRPDQFYGRALATSVEEFLENRKKATGDQACTPSEILAALEQGGFDFKTQGWKDDDRLRSLSITLGKNPKFHRLPNGTYGLLSWYPNVAAKKERSGKSGATESGEKEGSDANAA